MRNGIAGKIGATVVLLGLVLLGLSAFANRSGGAPNKIVLATGNAEYTALAEKLRGELAASGVQLELRDTTEGYATLRELAEAGSGVTAGFVKGGLVGSLQGRLASQKARDWREKQIGKWLSIGRMFYEPIWVFTNGDLPIHTLRQLKGKRILIGREDGATRRIAGQLLKANGIDANDATLIEEVLEPTAAQIVEGKVDAAILVGAADSERMQKLLRVPGIRLMNFAPEADAYTSRFPYLTKLVLKEGAVEFEPLVPSADITLLATSTALVVRSDMHPALISLLTYAAIRNPRPGFDKAGDPVLFFKAGEFPSPQDPEFQMSADAVQVYKTGELPWLMRNLRPVNQKLGVPFSLTAFANAHGMQTIFLLLPALAVLYPLIRLLPSAYAWSVRQRLLYWYRQLTALEQNLNGPHGSLALAEKRDELARIDAGVRRMTIPVYFANQYYDLRGHIELVRLRLWADQPGLDDGPGLDGGVGSDQASAA